MNLKPLNQFIKSFKAKLKDPLVQKKLKHISAEYFVESSLIELMGRTKIEDNDAADKSIETALECLLMAVVKRNL